MHNNFHVNCGSKDGDQGTLKQPVATKADVIFVDFHGTLCASSYWSTLSPELFAKIQTLLFVDSPLVVLEWMRGRLTSEDICQFLSQRIEICYEDAFDALKSSCAKFFVDNIVLKKIQRLREWVPVYLVTSNMDCFSRFVAPALRLHLMFSGIYNSADLGQLKDENDGQLFLDICRKEHLQIRRAILLDDSPAVCDVFEKLGGMAKLVQNYRITSHHLSLDM